MKNLRLPNFDPSEKTVVGEGIKLTPSEMKQLKMFDTAPKGVRDQLKSSLNLKSMSARKIIPEEDSSINANMQA